jgi:signal transduction histidine kinase
VTRKALLEGCIDAGIYASDEVAAVLRKTLGTVGGIGSRHMVQRLADGNVIEVTTTPLPDGGTVATYTNVTPREKREQEMRAARDAAEAANRAKSAFLANMSHELRTPLNAVIGFSDVMKAEMFGPLGNAVYLSYASDIHASGQLLLDLINDILDISKIEAGKAEVAEEVFDLHEVVEASILLCREQAAASSLALRARVAADLPRVRGDARYIRQILLNLVSNAVKFTPSGGRVTVCVWRQAGGGIVLTVADTGIGIPEQMQARVFEPFFQVQSDLARQYQGTGLGLSLVKGLTELHGGRVEIEARRRQGTIFRVRLPAYRNVSP